jgi:hypothetical protein
MRSLSFRAAVVVVVDADACQVLRLFFPGSNCVVDSSIHGLVPILAVYQ